MKLSRTVLVLTILAMVLVPAVGLACDADKKAAAVAEGKCPCGMDAAACGQATASVATSDAPALDENARLALAAEGGCKASASALIAVAKESGDAELAALAAKAEGGCSHSMAALTAKMKGGATPAAATPSCAAVSTDMATLARLAQGGCQVSATKLIEMAKTSSDASLAALATQAEGGCEHSRQELIAQASKTASAAK
jgi:hypothetical protein